MSVRRCRRYALQGEKSWRVPASINKHAHFNQQRCGFSTFLPHASQSLCSYQTSPIAMSSTVAGSVSDAWANMDSAEVHYFNR